MSRRRTWTALIVVVVLAASAGGVWVATGSSAATYRWSTARKGDVDQTLNSYGTIVPIHQAAVAFPVGGTVATVPVKVGQHVASGQVLATLEVSALQSRLDTARATLASAQAKLVTDTQAQATGATVAATASTSNSLGPASAGPAVPLSSSGSGTKSTGSGGSTSAAQAAVTTAQKKLLADQHAVDNLTSVVTADLSTGTATCASLIASLHNLAATPAAPTPTASPSTGGGSGGSGDSGITIPDTSACTTLLNKILADQQAVTAAQATVSADETTLTGAVAQLVAAAKDAAQSGPSTGSGGSSPSSNAGGSGRTGTGTGTGTSSGSNSGGSFSSGSSPTGSGGGGGGTTVTAAQLVVDQTTVDADTAAMIVAAEGVNQATILSPLAGTVAAVSVSAGSTASAQTAAVTVIGPGADQVSTSVSDLDLGKIHIGQSASVTTDGSNTPIQGTVTAIGLLPVSTSSSSSSGSNSSSSTASSSASYPVTISLQTGGLYSGSGADVSIVVKRSTGVLAVPTSAVTALGSRHTVTVQQGGKAVRKLVEVGASDATLTQITSGLAAGDRVALAQLNMPLPSSSSTLTGRGGGLGRTGAGLGTGGGTGFGGAPATTGRGG